MTTQVVTMVGYEYRKISRGQKGEFVNRDFSNYGEILVAEQKPDVSVHGDPMAPLNRHQYDLDVGLSVWGKAKSGTFNVGVTPALNSDSKELRAVSSGLRLPVKFSSSASHAHAMSRIRRKALVDMSGVIKFIMPLFHMDRPASLLREIDFPDPCRIKVGIEPLYMTGGTNLSSSPKLFSEEYIYDPESNVGYVILEIDLGNTVIPKGQHYGIWTAYDNLKVDAPWFLPYSNKANSETDATLFEYAATRSPASGSYITTGDFSGLDTISAQTTVRDCYGPVALICSTTSDVWVMFGSSSLEGAYDNSQGDARGDEDANRSWGDRLITGRYSLPSVNLAKGSDSLGYVTAIDTEVTPNRPIMQYRKAIAALCAPTHIALTIGSNDISSSLTEQSFKDMFQQHIDDIKGSVTTANTFFSATYTPKITWASPYVELSDQTVNPVGLTGNDPLRQEFNRWMRESTGDLDVDGYIDAALVCESLSELGKWQVDSVTPKWLTDDGTHPNAVGAAKIAAEAPIMNYYK